MLTLEQCKSLVSAECSHHGPWNGDCEECPIYNLFNRSGNCEYRLYDGQYHSEVAKLIEQLKESYPEIL